MVVVEVAQNEEISAGEENGGGNEVGSAIRRRRVNGGSINIRAMVCNRGGHASLGGIRKFTRGHES